MKPPESLSRVRLGAACGIPTDLQGREIDIDPIRGLLDRIVERWNPRGIRLFGSRARGDANPASDWDLLVVVPEDLPEGEFDPLTIWRVRRESGANADVVLCTAAEFDEDRNTPNTLAHEAWIRGVPLLER